MESQIQQASQPQKRNIAYKLRVGSILSAKPTIESERLKHLEINNQNIVRVNIIANIVDKYIQEGEKKFGSVTLDDATGQIKVKAFGDDVERFFGQLNQGDTVLVIGLLRIWNNEIYVNPEIIKKKELEFLLLRKLESEADEVKVQDTQQIRALAGKIIDMAKEAEKDGGIDVEKIVSVLNERVDIVNQEIKKLLEDGIIYEPRPGKIRWLG
jgi:uncharacterized protein